MAESYQMTRQKQRVNSSHLIRVGLVLIYLITTVTASLVVFTRVREMTIVTELLPAFTVADNGPSVNVEYLEGETLPTWTGTERVTILVMGVDERAQSDEKAWRTDTMILVTLDPVTLQAGVLSIPRDLWVEIPTMGYNRINTAHYFGDFYDYPGGGPALAMRTVERALGIHIDHYVRLNFQAFINLIDQIGGIDIDVPETIDDPQYPDYNYGFDPLYIEAGQHHFYGEMALKYARVRHVGQGDFGRARRQQQVLQAVLDKISSPEMLPQLLARAPELYATAEDSVATGLKLDQIIALAQLANQVDRDTMRFAVIDENCTENWITPDDAMVLVPIRDRVRVIRDYVLGLADPEAAVNIGEEAATVSVLNGTESPGLAGATAKYLEANGITVTTYDNADRQDYDTSLIILNRNKPLTAAQLIKLLRLPQSALVKGENPTAAHDIVVILGQDYVQSLPDTP